MTKMGKTKIRIIDNKRYEAVSKHSSKTGATRSANSWRRKGFNVRIITSDTQKRGLEYIVYTG